MTLQSPGDLGLSALGVDGDLQPRSTLPSLVDGIHLRWGSGLDRGFPEYGYYLYRREHIGAQVTPHSLTDGLSESASLAVGETITAGDWSVTVEAATAASRRDEFTLAADGSISAGGDGVDELAISMQQSGRVSGSGNAGGSGRWSGFEPIVPRFPDPGSLKLSLPEPAFRVELTVAPEYPGDTPGQPTLPGWGMNATALAEDVTLDRATGLSRGTVTLRSDAITAIDITGSGSVLDVEIYPVSAQIDQNWQPVPKASAPITLPVTHPNYPAASGSEDLNAARTTIDDRIQYRDPDRYAGAWPSSQPSGTVTTTDGSPIVHGSGTGWTAADAGKVFRVAGDDSAYVVLTVLDSDRLVLSRPHDGATTGLNYDLVADDFGRLYDAMIDCVAGSDSQVGMAGRAVPQPVYDTGTVTLTPGSKTISGTGVAWNGDVAGLTLRVGMDLPGTITLEDGSRTVTGHETNWSDRIEGRILRVPDVRYGGQSASPSSVGYQASTYRIASVESETELTLQRPYVGRVPQRLPRVGTNQPRRRRPAATEYTIFRPERLSVASVEPQAETLTLAEPFRGGAPLTDRPHVLTAPVESASQATTEGVSRPTDGPSLPLQYPIDQLLIGSIDPALAQSLGLYWIDEDADPGTAYDYMILGAHGVDPATVNEGGDGGTVVTRDSDWRDRRSGSDQPADDQISLEPVLSLAARGDGPMSEPWIDAFVTFDRQRSDGDTLDPPVQPETYRLPGGSVPTPDGGTIARQSVVGLRWDHGDGGDPLGPGGPVAYYLWRHDFSGTPGRAPAGDTYSPVTRGESAGSGGLGSGIGGGLGSGIGGGLGSGIGGSSTGSSQAETMDADPLSGTEPVVPGPRSDAATRPEDWPSVPLTAIDGTVSDGWYSYRLSGVDPFGRHSDLSDPGPWYDFDPIEQKADSGPEQFAVEVADELPPPPPTAVEAAIRDPADPNVTTDSGNPELLVRWTWTAAHDEQAPDLSAFELHVEPGQFNATRGEITSRSPAGTGRSRVETTVAGGQPAGAYVGGSLRADGTSFAIVDSGGDPLWVVVEHVDHSDAGTDVAPPASGECSISVPAAYTDGTAEVLDGSTVVDGNGTDWQSAMAGQLFRTANDTHAYEIERVADATTLHLAEPYDRPADSSGRGPDADTLAYRISHPVGDDPGDPDAWSSTPTAWANAHGTVQPDQRTGPASEFPWEYEVTLPVPMTGSGGALDPGPDEPVVHAQVGVTSVDDGGTAGRVSAQAGVVRRHFGSPAEPSIPTADSAAVEASDPDYHGTSVYTFRWQRPTTDGLASHVYRAMDRTLFRVDWERRSGGETLSQSDARFPPNVSAARQREVITEINDHWASRAGDVETAVGNYRELSNDSLRVLASLPENDDAFTQLTTTPIAPDDSLDRMTPDMSDGYSPDPSTLHAYVDDLVGRADNAYFYRARTVDTGNNRSDTLSVASPVVQLPDVTPPGTPSLTGVIGGDLELTVAWRSVRDADLDHYRVYRTVEADATRDVRLMTEVATVSAAADPSQRPAVVEWTDTDVAAGTTYRYRVAAVDASGNESTAADPIGGAAFSTTPPDPPTWNRAQWVRINGSGTVQPWSAGGSGTPAIDLGWSLADRTEAVLLQRADSPTAMWQTVASWADRTSYHDESATTGSEYRYRLKVRDSAGNVATGPTKTVSPPGGN